MKQKVSHKLIVIFLIFILILGLTRFEENLISDFFQIVSRPIYSIFNYFGQKGYSVVNYFKSKNLIEKEKDLLKIKNEFLIEKLAQENDCQLEKEALTELLNVNNPEHNWQTVMGRISYANPAQDWAMINLGYRDGIRMNQPVINSRHILIGRINKVDEKKSEVALLSHIDSAIKVKNINENVAIGFIKGGGGGKIDLESNLSQPFKLGDDLVTDIFKDEYPANLLIGRIVEIKKNDLQSSLQAKVIPFLKIQEVSAIFVLTDF